MPDNQKLRTCEPASAPVQSQPDPPHRILVVEDDVSILQLITKALIHSGYKVDGAEDGAAAWQALNTDSYDLLITDNNMPRVSGVELLKKLHAVHMELPVIMATGTLPKDEFSRYPWIQPAATLLKPFIFEELLQLVRKVLCQEVSPSVARRPRPAHSAPRVLVVDGDHDLCWLYSEALRSRGCRVDTAADGVAGWEALQADLYDLLITEHDMPKLTGVELVTKLRSARMALPVVMAAGRLPVHELARNPALQLAATLVKPFGVDVLLDTVESVLRVAENPHEQIAPPNWRSQPVAAGLGR
jgi:DNA-binding response OmpR family regulator